MQHCQEQRHIHAHAYTLKQLGACLAYITTALAEAQREVWEEAAKLAEEYDPQGTLFTQATVRDGIARLLHRRSRAHDAV